MQIAELIVTVITYHLFAGVFVAIVFLVFGIERVEPGAQGSYAFRTLLLPGLITLWPLVLWRWVAVERERHDT